MSKQGIKKFAKILSVMQEARGELLNGEDNQDIRLGQLLDDAKDAVKDRFCEITLEKETKNKKPKVKKDLLWKKEIKKGDWVALRQAFLLTDNPEIFQVKGWTIWNPYRVLIDLSNGTSYDPADVVKVFQNGKK